MIKILVVDDVKEDRDVMSAILKTNKNYEISEASDGISGLATAIRTLPDIIIADICMPNSDGYQLVRDVRHNPSIANTEFIFYSGIFSNKSAGLKAVFASGVKRMMIKPVEPIEALDEIASVLQAIRLRLTAICPKFITQIEELVRQADAFSTSERTWESDVFTNWKLKAHELITSMSKEGCNLGDRSLTRYYHLLPISGTLKQESEAFDSDLRLTVNELKGGQAYFQRRLAEGGVIA